MTTQSCGSLLAGGHLELERFDNVNRIRTVFDLALHRKVNLRPTPRPWMSRDGPECHVNIT